jgi:hypothetical protein
MSTKFIFKKTKDFSLSEREQVKRLFFRVFGKEKSDDSIKRRYLNSCKGYSYHGLMLYQNMVVGLFTAIPYFYTYFGRKMTFALSVDTMIDPEHRGGKTSLLTMANLGYEALVDDNIPFIYGFPNELYYNHEKIILNTKDIGRLNYYVLPINIGAVFSKLRMLNPLSRISAKMIKSFPGIRHSTEYKYNIEKVNNELFEMHRYNNTYHTIKLDNGAKCIYKIYNEVNDIRTLYLIDVLPLSPNSFEEAIRYIYKAEADSIDILIYVGKLQFIPRNLIKVPRFLEPQKIRMTGKILIPGLVDESVFEIGNWNVNISNFDVR